MIRVADLVARLRRTPKPPPVEVARKRLVIAGAVFAAVFGVISIRLGEVVLWRGGEAEQRTDAVPASRPDYGRGDIRDRNGEIIATSLPTQSLGANPHLIDDPEDVARRLAKVLPSLNPAEILQRLKADRQFIWLARQLTPRQQEDVLRLGVPGFEFRREERRFYPQGRTAAHVVGFVNIDGKGEQGIEKQFDDVLRKPGESVTLSLDMRVQYILREEIIRGMEKFDAIGGGGIVLDVNNGEVLAMVSLPDFDPNDPGDLVGDKERYNRMTYGAFEMGSIFKLMTASMALDDGVARLDSTFDARRPIQYGRFQISDFKGKHRWLALPEVLIYSSNIGAARIAQEVGIERQREFLGRMGLLSRLRIELPEVSPPEIPNPWREINMMTIAFGHGIAVTPLQLGNAVAAVANGGILRPTTLLKRLDDAPVQGKRVISEKVSRDMRWIMRMVCTEGSGKFADTAAWPVGGKTGTSQKVNRQTGRYDLHKRLSTFVGVFPIQQPRYLIMAMLDEPKGNKSTYGYATAGWVSAPIAHNVIERIAPLLGVPPLPDTPAAPQPTLVRTAARTEAR